MKKAHIVLSGLLLSALVFFILSLTLSENASALMPLSIWLWGFTPLATVIFYRKKIKLMWVVGPLSFILFLFFLEIGLRQEPFNYMFLPANTGKDFSSHKFLFWKATSNNSKDTLDSQNLESLYPGEQLNVNIETDSIGFRSGPVNKLKEKGVFRIVTMGGSNAWGYRIENYNNTFSGRLDAMLQKNYPNIKSEIISAGVGGYCLFQNLVLYKLFIRQYNPDLIILYGNINESPSPSGPFTYRELFKLRSGVDISKLWIDEHDFPKSKSPLVSIQDTLRKSRIYNAMTDLITDTRKETVSTNEKTNILKEVNPTSHYKQNLIDLITMIQKDGGKLICADAYYFDGPMDNREPVPIDRDKTRAIMKEVTLSMGEIYIPVYDIFLKREDCKELVFFPDDVEHLNLKGHDALAKILFEVMEKNGILEKAEKINKEENSPPIGIPNSYSF